MPETPITALMLALTHERSDPAALNQFLEQLRRQRSAPVPIPMMLGSHVPDAPVPSHPLESYDHDDSDPDPTA